MTTTASAASVEQLQPHVDIDDGLSIDALVRVAEGTLAVSVGEDARRRMERSQAMLWEWLSTGESVYGASSGVGDLAHRDVAEDDALRLQLNIVRSHCCGLGDELPAAVVRAAIASRAAVLARGYSAVRPAVVELMLALLSRDITPCVPAEGSVGASGDPILLAHVAAVIVGEGAARTSDGALLPGGDALAVAGLEPLRLGPGEGLALVNGLDFSIAAGALALASNRRVLEWADGVAALTLEALAGSSQPFLERVQRVRGQGGNLRVAEKIRARIGGSDLVGQPSGGPGPQDPYSLRCVPQVHGSAWDVLAHAEHVVAGELAAVIDNPLIFPETGEVLHCGHFHGQALASAFDYLAVANVAVANMVHARLSLALRGVRGLPPVLADDVGVESGLMMLETASASLVARARALACPLSVQSIPASALQEDHVSMAWEAVRRFQELTRLLAEVVALEAAASAAACELRSVDLLGAGSRRLHTAVRGVLPSRRGDAALTPALRRLVRTIEASPCPA